jgi:hypothetical protein
MSYEEQHSEDDCDKCNEKVGKINLFPLPFIYLDHNDKAHPNLGRGYRQYYVCKNCLEKEKR